MQHGWQYLTPEDEATILRGIREGRAFGGPYHVEIDPVDACNVACFFCGSADLHQGGILRWDKLGPAVERWIAGGLRSFRLAGGGEPLIYPDLGLLCDRMAEAGIALDNLTTNGVTMNRWIDHLLKLRLNHILFSLNYASAPQYGRFMRTAESKFDSVVKNMNQMHDRLVAAGRRTEPMLITQFFIHRSTVADLPMIAEFARTLPVDLVTVKSIGYIPQEEVLRPEDVETLRRQLPKLVTDLAPHKALELDFSNCGLQPLALELLAEARGWPMEIMAPPREIEYCYIAWHSTTVRGSGDVHACCHLMPEKTIPPLGNITTQDFDAIWHGPMYQQFRDEMRTAMLMQEKTPFQQRRFKCTLPFCWKHDACPLAHSMASPDFYRTAHENLQELRRRPLTMAARAANGASRKVIEGAKRLVPAG